MGVPVVTQAGQRAIGRGGVSILSNLKLTELIASERDEYVAVAIRLANDLPRLTEYRSSLRQNLLKSPLMKAPEFTLDYESALQEIWRQRGDSIAK